MKINQIQSFFTGNHTTQTTKENQDSQVSSEVISTPTPLIKPEVGNALKAQVNFGKKETEEKIVPTGINTGEVNKTKTINIILNGEEQISDNLEYKINNFKISSKKNEEDREILIEQDKKTIFKGIIPDSLSKKTKIEFNAAKHEPEVNLILEDNTTHKMLKGSYIDNKDGLKLYMPGKFQVLKNKDTIEKREINSEGKLTQDVKFKDGRISFTGNFVSLLYKKDSTVDATNSSKEIADKYISGGLGAEMVHKDDPTFAVLGGGFGTRFANMTGNETNKPSYIMPNGHSIISAALDLIRTATNAPIEKMTYLEQTNDEYPEISKEIKDEIINNGSKVIKSDVYNSDGGAIINAVLEGNIKRNKPLIILNADTITNVDLSQLYPKLKEEDTAMVIPSYLVNEERAKSFGLICSQTNKKDEIKEFVEKTKDPAKNAKNAQVEKKDGTMYAANPGIYMFSSNILQEDNLNKILEKAKEIAKTDNTMSEKEIFDQSTFLGKAFVPAVVELCNNGELTTTIIDKNGNEKVITLKAKTDEMKTISRKSAFWDDIGTAEAFVNDCQEIAYETVKKEDDIANNKYIGIRGLQDFAKSVDVYNGTVFASPKDRENYKNKHKDEFNLLGDIYVTCNQE